VRQEAHKDLMSRLRPVIAEYLGLALVLVGLVVAFGFLRKSFFTVLTFRTIANEVPEAIIIAVGMTLVLIIGGIDLSVGSILSLSGAVLAVCVSNKRGGLPVPLGVLAGLGVGLACGALNGLMTIAWRLPSFIVTLGMLEMARGGAYLVTRRETEYVGSKIAGIAGTSVLGLSLPFLIAVGIVIVAQFVLSKTVFGRYMVAIGTNEEAVRLSGIDPRPVKVAVFALCGLLAAVAAVTQTSRHESADPNAGEGYELRAIAAVVIGGTSLMGGRGSVAASFFGVLIMSVLDAGLTQLGAQAPTKRLVTGGVIIAAVIADYYRRRVTREGRET
jgi:ribose transport system permease protein